MSETLYSYARQCSLSAANTTVVQLSQTEGDLSTSQDSYDTIIASRDEHDTERRTAHVSQDKPVTKPNDGTGLASLGPRPLMLGTFQICTPSPTASPRSRPHSSSSRAPRTPTVASARWSSYTSPLTPLSQLSPSPVSDEVESLKTQLAASEALVKQLTKEKFEAVSASRELFADVQSLQEEHNQWLEEREVLMAKLGLLDEVEATPGLLPSSEEVWFAGSNQTPPQTHAPLLSPISISRNHRNLETPPSETHQVPEVTVGQPAASGRAHAEPLVSEVDITDDDVLAQIGSIFLALTPADDHDGCNPGNTPSPASTPMAPYLSAIDPTSPTLAYLSPPRANRRSRQCRNAIDGSQFGQPAASERAYEVTGSRPAASDRTHSDPVVGKIDIIDDDEALSRIGSIFLALTPVDDRDGCNTPLPTSTPMPSYFPTIDSTSRSTLLSPPRAHRLSRHRRNAINPVIHPIVENATPLSTPSPPPSLNALGLPSGCTPNSPVRGLIPPPARSVSASAQVPRPQPDLVDLASRTVGSDPCPGYPGRRNLNDCAESFLKEVNAAAAAGSRPSMNLATGVELHAAMARVSASTARPRLASEFTKWQAISEPEIQKEPIDPLRESGFAALVRSKRKRPIPQLRARGFTPCSSPLANPPLTNPPENPEEEQNRAEISQAKPVPTPARRAEAPLEEAEMNRLPSSPLVNPPENAKQGQSKKRTQLGKLLKQVKSWISRNA